MSERGKTEERDRASGRREGGGEAKKEKERCGLKSEK